jgi:hypothetical protein
MPKSRYLIGAVLRARDLLEAFQLEGELLRLRDPRSRHGLCGCGARRSDRRQRIIAPERQPEI